MIASRALWPAYITLPPSLLLRLEYITTPRGRADGSWPGRHSDWPVRALWMPLPFAPDLVADASRDGLAVAVCKSCDCMVWPSGAFARFADTEVSLLPEAFRDTARLERGV
jgi:hypothetical protein